MKGRNKDGKRTHGTQKCQVTVKEFGVIDLTSLWGEKNDWKGKGNKMNPLS